MKNGKLNDKKTYYLRKKGSRSVGNIELRNITRLSSEVSYWYYDNLEENKGVDGTLFHVITVIPRIAGADYYVDHGGEVLTKDVIVPKGKTIRVHPALIINPETGEYELDDDYMLES